MANHVFAKIAPEANDEELSAKYLNVWQWCIRCGVLKLGRKYFVQGLKHKPTLQGLRKAPPCVPNTEMLLNTYRTEQGRILEKWYRGGRRSADKAGKAG